MKPFKNNNAIVVVGSINADLVVRAPRHPAVGETLTGSDFTVFTGGKGANQAAAAARLGHEVHLLGKVGTDIFASKPLEELRGTGVNTECVGIADGPTGMAAILTSEAGENSIVVVPGANARLLPSDLAAHHELIANAGIVLTQCETPIATLEDLACRCHVAERPLILDPAPAQALPASVLRRLTWITPNESEAEILLGRSIDSDSSQLLRAAAEDFLDMGVRNVILKLGARGTYLAMEDGTREYIPAFAVSAVDTTAAGDAFNGGFAVALMRGATAPEAVRFGAAVAAVSVTKHGALPSMPSLRDVEALLAANRIPAATM